MTTLKDWLIEKLSYTDIFEQAMKLKTFRESIYGHLTQILQNWALIYVARTYDINKDLVQHWKTELLTQCDEIIDSTLKSGNKRKTLHKLIVNEYEYDNPTVVYKKLRRKFNTENLLDKHTKSAAHYISTNIEELIDILSLESCDEWVENL